MSKQYHNFYCCLCGEKWDVVKDSTYISRCPKCNIRVQPFKSELLKTKIAKRRKPIPIHGLFHTPKDADEVIAWCDRLPPSERITAIIAATMMWNTLATQVNKAFALEVSNERG